MVLVTGATGAIGPRVVQALHEAGFSIHTFSRNPPPMDMLPADVETHVGDVTDQSIVQAAMQGIDVVIHLAALLHVVNPPLALQERYEQINVGGTANVVQAAIASGVRRVVLFSTIAVYGYSTGQVLTEDSPSQPDTLYGITKLAAERIVLGARRTDGQPLGTVLRVGAIYGARVKGNYAQLVRALARKRFIPVGAGQNRRSLIYERDAAQAAVLAATHPAAAGRVYNITDGKYHTLNEINAAMCEALSRKPPRCALPVRPVRLAAGILEDGLRVLGRKSPIGRATVDKFIEDVAVDGSRIQRELGFVPRYDLRAGWRETIREMRQRHLL